jgi:predicted amidohydrolase
MTANRNLKRRVRQRAARTGESYASARRHLVPPPAARIATGQLPLRPDPGDPVQLRASGDAVRALMRTARSLGAALIHLPEGALTSPHKRVMSSTGPLELGPADWDRVDWTVLDEQLRGVAGLARELRLWTVVGGIHRAAGGQRPANCLHVIDDRGRFAARYDERMLSPTKASLMYAPGTAPLVVQAAGLRLGLALGMETRYAEIFTEYESLGVDMVLFSTHGNSESPRVFAIEAAGHAASNSLWVSYSGPSDEGHPAAGLLTPTGEWAARCEPATAGVVTADVLPDTGVRDRQWRRVVRARARRQ